MGSLLAVPRIHPPGRKVTIAIQGWLDVSAVLSLPRQDSNIRDLHHSRLEYAASFPSAVL